MNIMQEYKDLYFKFESGFVKVNLVLCHDLSFCLQY